MKTQETQNTTELTARQERERPFVESFKRASLGKRIDLLQQGFVAIDMIEEEGRERFPSGTMNALEALEAANHSQDELVELFRPILISSRDKTKTMEKILDPYYLSDDFIGDLKFILQKISSEILLGYLESVKDSVKEKNNYLAELVRKISIPDCWRMDVKSEDEIAQISPNIEEVLLSEMVEYTLFKNKKVWIDIKNPEEFLKTAPGIDDDARSRAIRDLNEKRQNIARKIEYANEAADAGDEGARSLLLDLDPSQLPFIKQYLNERVKARNEEAVQVKKNAETFSSSQGTKFKYIDDILSTEKRIKESCRQTE